MNYNCALLLCAIGHGDCMAKVPPLPSREKDFEKHFLGLYEKAARGGVFPRENLGLLINITGFSGCGKTTTAKTIINYLEENFALKKEKDILWVNRDNEISEVVFEKEPSIRGKGYGEVFEFYKKEKEALSPLVNQRMGEKITRVLSAGERVCIVDTMALMDFRVRVSLLSSVPSDTVSIDVWVHCLLDSSYYKEETQERLGLTLQEQLEINRQRGNKKSSMDVIGSNIVWDLLDSMIEGQGNTATTRAKSHYLIPVRHGRRDLMFESLKYLLKELMEEKGSALGKGVALPPLLEDGPKEDMSLIHLVRPPRENGGDEVSNHSRLKRFFKKHNYMVSLTPFGNTKHVLCCKYIDKKNKLMKYKWAREARGAGFVIEGSRVVQIKQPLNRCVEALSMWPKAWTLPKTWVQYGTLNF